MAVIKKTPGKSPARPRSQASAAADVALGDVLFGQNSNVIPTFTGQKRVTVPSSPRGMETEPVAPVTEVIPSPVAQAPITEQPTQSGAGNIGGNETLTSVIQSFLDQYKIGNSGLVADIVTAIGDGRLDGNSKTILDDIGVVLSDNEYIKTRFSANVERKKAGLQALPITEILGMENGYITAMQAANLPAGFYDDPATDFQNLIARNVSVAEVDRRIKQGYAAVKTADPEVVNQLKNLYGVSEGTLAAYFLDPARMEAEISKQVEAAQLAAQGRQVAGIQLTQQEAEQLQQAGVSTARAREGFGTIAQQQELFTPTTGEAAAGETGITTGEQVASEFGLSPQAAQRVATRRRRRTAAFEAGGRFAQTNQFSVGGLGTANQ